MIKVGDTFKADGYTWKYESKDDIGIHTFECENNRLIRFIYENDDSKFNENRWCAIEYAEKRDEQGLSQEEMRMCIEIIDKLKGERE